MLFQTSTCVPCQRLACLICKALLKNRSCHTYHISGALISMVTGSRRSSASSFVYWTLPHVTIVGAQNLGTDLEDLRPERPKMCHLEDSIEKASQICVRRLFMSSQISRKVEHNLLLGTSFRVMSRGFSRRSRTASTYSN